ncbi:F-box protein [Cocos nucifera]|uniref:F-box protein n=1 Tax=Cocos nucifera TaxID=13894 RepID=A0A8K0N5N1_COCNU|nr:F-box protein [Cocos nucifera]
MASGVEQGPEWSHLPHELLALISKKITHISNYILFRSVCRSWRSAAQPANLCSQFPLLMLPHDPFSNDLSFFSLSTNSMHNLSLPITQGKAVLTSSHGWLVILDIITADLSLLNPITAAQVQLPPTTGFYRSSPSEGVHCCYRWVYPWHAFLSSSPNSADDDCVVMVSDGGSCTIYYCRPGDEAWTVLRIGSYPYLLSVICHENWFYVLDDEWILTIYDTSAGASKRAVISSQAGCFFGMGSYLAKTSTAEMLWIACHKENEGDQSHCSKKLFEVMKLDLGGHLLEWSKIESVGEKAVFCAQGQCFSVCAGDFPHCREDCIYFIPSTDFHHKPSDVHQIEVFNMKDGSIQVLPSVRWEKPSENASSSLMWFIPSLC